MNQLVEKMINLSLSSNHYEEIGKLILSYISKYEKNVNTTILLFVIVIIGSVYFSFFSNVSNKKAQLKPKSNNFERTRSWIVREIHSGDTILNRLKEDFYKARVNPATLKNTEKVLKALLREEYLDLIKIQQTVEKLEMSGSEDSAIKILEDAIRKANKKNKPHEAYEIQMFLVEMLIYKGEGELDNALNRACLKDDSLRDARRPLYKAIIHQMKANIIEKMKGNINKEKKKAMEFFSSKAMECWEEFVTLRDHNGPSYSFEKFKENVKKLQSSEDELYGKNLQKNIM